MHDGTIDFLKILTVLGFIVLSVWWLSGAIGNDYTVLVIFALIGVILFAGGALFAHMNQRMTLDALNKSNAQDAQIDRYRMQSFKAMAQGESAMQRAAAQLTVLDAKRVNQVAQQQAKLLTDTARRQWEFENKPQQTADVWTWDDDGSGDDTFQSWE